MAPSLPVASCRLRPAPAVRRGSGAPRLFWTILGSRGEVENFLNSPLLLIQFIINLLAVGPHGEGLPRLEEGIEDGKLAEFIVEKS